ncbi:Multiple inositol polyphosphate phosphatase [Fasciolopsis buskii]|uniref:Multiple inositol polyphosphate phosphatase 1 n=1 Tax=Fasciolopsis buskii TaxID=27845 RepID=A0A8E0RW31_9TREM|nr:Multiple inositol polyphosphate phosphatase [Fasciolopsis buski]
MSQSLGSLAAFVFAFMYVYVFNPLSENDVPWTQFSTKTAYRHCSLKPYKDPLYIRPVQSLASCNLVHVNALFRHGTRSPTQKDMVKSKNLFERLLSNPNIKLPKRFRDQPVPFENQTSKGLLPRGFEEHHLLGQLFRARMDRYMKVNISNVQFYASSIQRAIDSSRSFYHGFSGMPPLSPKYASVGCGSDVEPNDCPSDVVTERYKFIQEADKLLRFFTYCKRYVEEIESNKSSVMEYLKFREGPEVRRVVNNVRSRHSLPAAEFSENDIFLMYAVCSYEVAAETNPFKDHSPWCDFLRPNEAPVYEYMSDLKHYWRKSYGYELNYVQSCPLVGEMLRQIRNAAHLYKISQKSNQESAHEVPQATFWFGHAETLLPVVAALGLFNDSVDGSKSLSFTADDFIRWQDKRRMNPPSPMMFRAGHIAPFSGNLALQLYYLSIGVDDPWSGFFVEPLVNGQTVAWPLGSPFRVPTKKFPGATFAPLGTVLSRLGSCMPDRFDEDEVCSLPGKSTTETHGGTTVATESSEE